MMRPTLDVYNIGIKNLTSGTCRISIAVAGAAQDEFLKLV
jgi:hypothetical protein